MTDAAAKIDILPLTPERMEDLAALFGLGGDPKRCWCSFFRVRNADIINGTAQENRAVLERSLAATATQQRAPGLVAYRDSVPIGWVSVGPRDDYPRLQHSRVLGPLDELPTWSIVCFVVARGHRRRGVAAALLDAAVAYAREHGATLVEGYPADPSAGERISPASAYKGTLGMFEHAGFRVAARRQANRASPVRPIVRRRIRPLA